jgi:hypothetical protein
MFDLEIKIKLFIPEYIMVRSEFDTFLMMHMSDDTNGNLGTLHS